MAPTLKPEAMMPAVPAHGRCGNCQSDHCCKHGYIALPDASHMLCDPPCKALLQLLSCESRTYGRQASTATQHQPVAVQALSDEQFLRMQSRAPEDAVLPSVYLKLVVLCHAWMTPRCVHMLGRGLLLLQL